MRFIGDFHLHSHYSVATSKNLTPEYLDYWARIKGITVVGTGDFTHPGWLAELEEKLCPAEPGLYKLKPEYRRQFPTELSLYEKDVRFILTAEISSIYKKGGRVRKVHNLIFAPAFSTAKKLQGRLGKIGNITSDGRPILGIDSRDLLEIVLESSERCFFVPSHIWTPWFSVLGAQSGFDSIEECFADLSNHIHAAETGLSSDPPMNRLCSFLDNYTLISNSDAHSPEKLGREANLFDTAVQYDAIIDAMKAGDRRFLGTIEFFPQEGKYHYDGHRKCGIKTAPPESQKLDYICPVCGKKMTIGVMSRVVQLADRKEPGGKKEKIPFHSLIPLKEILSEITGVGPGSKKVQTLYSSIVRTGGSELGILLETPIDEIRVLGGELLSEGIRRMRDGEVIISEGFDGEFGTIRVFGEDKESSPTPERPLFAPQQPSSDAFPERLPQPEYAEGETENQKKKVLQVPGSRIAHGGPSEGDSIFDLEAYQNTSGTVAVEKGGFEIKSSENKTAVERLLPELDSEQLRAVQHETGPSLIIAGPGTGKTRVLTGRIARLILNGIDPTSVLAVTFTNRACDEMKRRLAALLNGDRLPDVCTFHSLGLEIIRGNIEKTERTTPFVILDDRIRRELISRAADTGKKGITDISDAISKAKRNVLTPSQVRDETTSRVFSRYEKLLRTYNSFDFDDLVCLPVLLFSTYGEVLSGYRQHYRWMLVDEYQDINYAQYLLMRMLMPSTDSNLFAIGDPDQAIYGFRGADAKFIRRFMLDYPGAALYNLRTSYRCSDFILGASAAMIQKRDEDRRFLKGVASGVKLQVVEHGSDRSEAEWAARTVERMIGGLGFFSMDSSITQGNGEKEIVSLADFAVLCRIKEQMKEVENAFNNHSIPFQTVANTPFFREEPIRSVIDLLKLAACPEQRFLQESLIQRGVLTAADTLPRPADFDGSVKENAVRAVDLYFKTLEKQNPAEIALLYELCGEFKDDFDSFFRYTDLGEGADMYRKDIEGVSVLTLHAAKGLEFQCVIVVGCEDGLLPYSLFKNQKGNPEEEKRLLYVGMTRAKKFLFLSHAKRRFLFGRTLQLKRSPFIDGIEEELLEKSEIVFSRNPKKDGGQLSLF